MNLPYHEDLRDYSMADYLAKIEKKNLIYKTWKISDIYDQGLNNSCVGYACALLLESEPNIKKTPDPEVIFTEAKKFDTKEKVGTGIRSGLKALQSMGYVKSYYWTDEITEIVVAILNLGPVIAGIDWYYGMNNATDHLYASGGFQGNHAILVYGVDLKKQEFLIANSHGYNWGTLGTARVSFATMAKIFKYGFAVEKKIEGVTQ